MVTFVTVFTLLNSFIVVIFLPRQLHFVNSIHSIKCTKQRMSKISLFQQKQKNRSKEKEKETIFSKEKEKNESFDGNGRRLVTQVWKNRWIQVKVIPDRQLFLSLTSIPYSSWWRFQLKYISVNLVRTCHSWKEKGQEKERDLSLTVAFLLLSMTTVTHPFPFFLSESVSIARTSWSLCHEQCSTEPL